MACSLQEKRVGAINGLNQSGKTSTTQHHVSLNDWDGSVVISGRWDLASRETWINVFLCEHVALGSPAHEVAWQEVGRWILSGHGVSSGGVPGPVSRAQRHDGVAWVEINH